mgnify:FL=1
MKNNFNLRKFLTENKLTASSKILKEELTFSFDEYSYEIDDAAYQAEVEAGIKAQLPNISDKVLQAIIDSSVEYYYDQREEDVPSSDIVDMAVDYYNDEMTGDSKPSAPRQKYDLSGVDLSGLDKGQREAFDKFVDVYLKPYGDTDTQEDLEIFVKQFGKVENAYDLDSLIPNSFQYDSDERESMQTQLRRAYLDDDQPINEISNFNLRKFLVENKLTSNSRSVNEGMTVVGHTPEELLKNAEELVAKAKELGLEASIKYNDNPGHEDKIRSVEIGKSGIQSHPELDAIQDRQFAEYDKNKPKDTKPSFKPKRLKKLTLGGKTYEIGDDDPNDDGRIESIEKYPNGYFITGGVYSDYGDGDGPKEGYGYAIDLKGNEMDEEDLEGRY